ncbi:ClbS/DfsB family four-helix bundle protein [Paenibacillus sp. 481]|uniref:ClbS/DfsB family four-helix bundle protein n=1 Tax=Paenibacillus sp. 481 TaxID=2835869 RepID=UPI001E51AFDF|nr:ClbS/DfsB family four-helix bundle protein [Paenibacillus sp. 481]UHA71851.1 ClbS/DfsB family four-helix bundle protein [Paenibacillus sp. 481]
MEPITNAHRQATASASIHHLLMQLGATDVQHTVDFYRTLFHFQLVDHYAPEGEMIWALLRANETSPIELAISKKTARTSEPQVNMEHGPINEQISLTLCTDNVLQSYQHVTEQGQQRSDLMLTPYQTLQFSLLTPDGYAITVSQATEQVRMSQQQLLQLIAVQYDKLTNLLQELSLEQAIQPGVQGPWSVKDILAHLTAWNERLLRWVEECEQGLVPITPEPGYSWAQIHELNEQAYLQQKETPFPTVIQHFNTVHEQVVSRIATWSDEQLNDAHAYSFSDQQPLWTVVGFNSFDHYRAHLAAIYKGLATLRANQ